MNIRLFFLLNLFVGMVLLSGCKKKSSAGLGGKASLRLVAKHHSSVIDSVTFYIKFNAVDAPNLSEYDLIQKAVTESPLNSYAIIGNLKPGDYYIYAEGWDPSISENVKGGIPYTIREEVLQNVTVAVTEKH